MAEKIIGDGFCDLVDKYDLDILFIQEVTRGGLRELEEKFGNMDWNLISNKKSNDCAIFYRGHITFSVNDDHPLDRFAKSIIYDTIVGNMRLNSVHIPRKVIDREDLLRFIHKNIKEEELPFIIGGDFNTTQNKIKSSTSFVFYNNPKTRTTSDKRKREAIDHIGGSDVFICTQEGSEPEFQDWLNHNLLWVELKLREDIDIFENINIKGANKHESYFAQVEDVVEDNPEENPSIEYVVEDNEFGSITNRETKEVEIEMEKKEDEDIRQGKVNKEDESDKKNENQKRMQEKYGIKKKRKRTESNLGNNQAFKKIKLDNEK